jgi:hypothetical protein
VAALCGQGGSRRWWPKEVAAAQGGSSGPGRQRQLEVARERTEATDLVGVICVWVSTWSKGEGVNSLTLITPSPNRHKLA